MTRRFASPYQRFHSPATMGTGVVVLSVLLGVAGCRGVPWASTGGHMRVVDEGETLPREAEQPPPTHAFERFSGYPAEAA